MKSFSHNDLILEFCAAQDHSLWMVFKEPTLGVHSGRPAKPDVLMINKSWTNYDVRAFEIKVKQSDLKKDIKELKFEKYRAWSHRITFVLGPGLDDSELKDHPVGIIKWTEKGFQTKRAAPTHKHSGEDMTRHWHMFHALNMGGSRYYPDLRIDKVRQAKEWIEIHNHGGEFKESYRRMNYGLNQLIRKADEAKHSPEKIIEDVKKKFKEELHDKIGINYWRRSDSVKDIVCNILQEEIYAMTSAMNKKIDILKKELGLDEK